MINLLPLEKNKLNIKEYHSRRLVAVSLLGLVILIVSLVMMGAFYWSAMIHYQSNLKLTTKTTATNADHNYQQIRQETKKLVTSLDQAYKETHSITATLNPILEAKMNGIKINSIHFEQGKGDSKPKTNLSITADTRKNASDFIAVLQQLPNVADVTHPILIDSRNIILPLEIIWQTKTKSKTS